jgi:BCD family chlorophyll transporter-like MFS transporter
MILELRVPASLVAIMLAIPLLAAPFRALIGFKSDTHKSLLGWKRVPFLWGGTMLQFAGLSIMPFALLVLSDGPRVGPSWIGHVGTALAFLLVGAGAHTTQTAGLALATDVVSEDKRPRVIALMYLMMLMGTLISALFLESVLRDFTPLRLIQVIQGTAVFTIVVNMISLWKQEARVRGVVEYAKGERRPMFREASVCSSRRGSASSPSISRMSCSSRTAGKCSACPCRRPPCSPPSWPRVLSSPSGSRRRCSAASRIRFASPRSGP